MARDARLSILTVQEVDDLYGLPRFTEDDRRLYFDLSPAERELVDGVFTISGSWTTSAGPSISGKFRVKTEAEQQIWNECSRLIANAIIYYNTLLLSRVYEQKVAAGDLEAIEILKSTSPVAWRNVNLIGNFDFTTSPSPVDIEALAARYQNEDFWRRSMTEGDGDGPQE